MIKQELIHVKIINLLTKVNCLSIKLSLKVDCARGSYFFIQKNFSLFFRVKMSSSHLNWLIIRNHHSHMLKRTNIPKPFSTVSIHFSNKK